MKRRAAARIFAGALALAAGPAFAEDSFLDSVGKAAGLIAPTPDPPDFVKASRPKETPDEIPAFAAPPEPRSRVKTPAELKAMDEDLTRASRRQAGAAAGPAKRPRKTPAPQP